MLRPYQTDLQHSVNAQMAAGRRRVLMVLPTGGGKTRIFCDVASRLGAAGRKVCILVHRRELLTQASAALTGLGVAHGRVSPADRLDLSHNVQVASVQTLVSRQAVMTASGWVPSLVVVDEAHHTPAGSWAKVLTGWAGAFVLGVTATPIRLDGRGLAEWYDAMVEGPTMRTLIDDGFLSPFRVFAPSGRISTEGVAVRGGDFARGALEAAADRAAITGSAVREYQRTMPGAPAIAFCVSVAHAEHVAAEFRGAGWRAASVDGQLDDRERARRIAGLGNGSLDVLTSCEIVSEGTDVPAVTGAILLRPTASLGMYLQQVGRVLRPAPGKRHAIILDHAGNVLRHGMPDAERRWSLASGIVADRETVTATPYTCPRCFCQMPRPVSVPECWECGAPIEAKARQVNSVDGDLREITESAPVDIDWKRRWFQLKGVAEKRGMKDPDGWATATLTLQRRQAEARQIAAREVVCDE